MLRQIQSANDTIDGVGALQANPTDPYKDRLLKLIPAEIVTAYVSIKGIVNAAEKGDKTTLLWIVIAVLTLPVPVYLIFISKVNKAGQVIFTTIAFIIWVFATGSPAETILGFNSMLFGSVLLIIYTLATPLFYKGDS